MRVVQYLRLHREYGRRTYYHTENPYSLPSAIPQLLRCVSAQPVAGEPTQLVLML
jgi:hypothetical protein